MKQASDTVIVELPVKEPKEQDYRQRHINLQLGPEEAEACKAILVALDEQGARLLNGRRVQNGVDVVRFVFQKIYQQYQVV